MSGRTSFWAHDAAWHRRERQVMLGMEFGAVGPNILAVLHSWAQEQKHTGEVKGGFVALARETFADNGGQTRTVVEFAAKIGALDDLSVSDDGLLFTAWISGWEAEQPTGQDTIKRRGRRAKEPEKALENKGRTSPDTPGQVRTSPDDVQECPPTNTNTTTRPDQTSGGGVAGAPDPVFAVSDMLKAAGFDAIAVENDYSAIRQTLAERKPPAETDWDIVGQRIKRLVLEGTIEQGRPVSALRFVVNGRAALPRVGDASRPGAGLFRSTTGVDPAMAAKYGDPA